MTNQYTWVSWNRHKKAYDLVLAGACIGFLAIFVGLGFLASGPDAPDPMVMLIRATGTLSVVLLHVILCIGPLARLSPRWLPLLYNRRHLGVTMFLFGLAHAGLVILYYHGFGITNPLVSPLVNTNRSGIGFEMYGLAALAILFVMAATSHDFWLHTLTPRLWKTLHMLVYAAYGLLVLHVAFGAMQSELHIAYPTLLGIGIAIVSTLHLVAGLKETGRDRSALEANGTWVDVGEIGEIAEDRAKVVCVKGDERVAVFKHGGKLSAVSNVCEHQMGPLGEGKIVDGCITCPWHGYQYRPEDGCSPPPFTEKIATYELRIENGRVLLNPEAKPRGTRIEPAPVPSEPEASSG